MEAKPTDSAGVVLLILVARPFTMAARTRPMLKTPPHGEPVEELGNQDCTETNPNHILEVPRWIEFNYSST